MSLQPPRDIQVVKKENKAAWLEDFIRTHTAHLDPRLATNSSDAVDITVFARSIESPVVQALGKRCAHLSAATARVRMILTGLELEDIDNSKWCAALARAGVSVRIVSDPRLLDAHEQMTLQEGVSWIGDCLRREPAKRDAYERYAPNCRATWDSAHATFEMIWARAVDLALPTVVSGDDHDLPALGMDAAGVAGELDGATAATRH